MSIAVFLVFFLECSLEDVLEETFLETFSLAKKFKGTVLDIQIKVAMVTQSPLTCIQKFFSSCRLPPVTLAPQ